jgi:hypothetical protein
MADRTTKLLLFCIALALWGLLMRPTFTPMPVKAEGSRLPLDAGPESLPLRLERSLRAGSGDLRSGEGYLREPRAIAIGSRAPDPET